VGASERNIIARIALENLQRVGFPGRVVGIHPSGTPMGGVQVVPSLGEAGPIDLCLLAIGAPRLEHALREAAEAGVPAAVIPGAGANEGGPEVQPVLRQVIEDTGIEVTYKEVIQENASFFAKVRPQLAAGRSIDHDLIVITNGIQFTQLVQLGYVAPLDHLDPAQVDEPATQPLLETHVQRLEQSATQRVHPVGQQHRDRGVHLGP
jgi:hypothetical protein